MTRLALILLLLASTCVRAAVGDLIGASTSVDGKRLNLWFSSTDTNGTITFGYGTNNTPPVTPRMRLRFLSPGFTDTGTTNNLLRESIGTAVLRKPYNQQAFRQVVAAGTDCVATFALSETIHVLDHTLTLDLAANTYSNNAAATSFTVTNLSTVPWPRDIVMWKKVSHQLVGSSYSLTAIGGHASAQLYRPLRMIEFWGVDSAGNRSPTNRVTTMSLLTETGEPFGTPVWTTTLDGSAFTQGLTISNYFKAYPWWGPALDASDGVNVPDHPDYAPLLMYCNKADSFKRAYATVDPVNGVSAGVASTNLTTALASTPFATIAQAINAVGATNNTVNSENNLAACTVYLTNGVYKLFGGETITTRNVPGPWTTVTARPDIDWTTARIHTNTINQTGQKTLKLQFKNVVFDNTNDAAMISQGYGHVWIDECKFYTNTGASGTFVAFHTNLWITGSEFMKMRLGLAPSASTANSSVRVWGNTFRGFSDGAQIASWNPVIGWGNRIIPSTNEQYRFVNDQAGIMDPFIWGYNEMYRADATVYTMSIFLSITAAVTNGGMIWNNLIEITKTGSGVPFDVMESQHANETCTNLNFWNNTILAVYHPPFELGNVTGRTLVDYSDKNNIYGDREVSFDVISTDTDNTNRWAYLFGVDCYGNAQTEITANNGHPAGTELGFDGINTAYATNLPSYWQFTTNAAAYGGTTNGVGDYRLLSTSPAIAVPTHRAMLLPYGFNERGRGGSDGPGAYVGASPVRTAGFFF